MAVRIDRFGNNYADNLLSYKMLYDNTDTWTVNSGTGSASTTLGNAFVGDRCLKIQNTDVVNDITVTNTTHATTINSTMTCGLSFYLYKNQALQAVIGNIKIFKNAVLLDTQTFTLGTNNVDTDEDSVWVRFMSDQSYNFIKGDVITFTFTVDGIAGSPLGTLDLYIDGMMLYQMNRNNYVTPIYTRPISIEPIQMFGVYNYDDDATGTTPISLTTNTWIHVTNDGAGANTFTSGGLSGVTPYIVGTGLFDWSDLSLYDTIDIRFDALITTTSANEFVQVRMLLSVGSLDIPLTFISSQFKSAGTYPLVGSVKVVIYTENVRTTSAKFECKTDGASSTLEVNGWSMQVNKQMV